MKTSETHPIRLDFVESSGYPVLNRLGMTLAPGKKEEYGIGGNWNRDLAQDLIRLKVHYKIDTLVSLLEPDELRLLRIEDLPIACTGQRIELVRFPIKDGSAPSSLAEFSRMIGRIGERLCDDRAVAIHCRAGLGRTGLTTACAIVAISEGRIDATKAIEMTRRARNGTVETREQENFIVGFSEDIRSAYSGEDRLSG